MILLILIIGLVLYIFNETKIWFAPNEVEVKQTSTSKTYVDPEETLRLGTITKLNGNNIQYLRLNAIKQKRGYQKNTRNIVFFEGDDMKSHWLFETNNNKIEIIDHLQKSEDELEQRETIALYYQLRNEDTDNNGKIDKNDTLKIALTSPNGHDYTEITKGMTSVLDHSIDEDALVLTLLTQVEDTLIMTKYSLQTKMKISEREITRIGKKF